MSSAEALFATLVVLIVPGLLVAGLVRWPFRSLTTWAGVPVLSLGVIFLLAELASIGSRFGVPAFVILVGLLGTALLARGWRDHMASLRGWRITEVTEETSARSGVAAVPEGGHGAASGYERSASGTADRLSYGLLVISILFGLFIWVHAMHGGVVPPQIDSSNHGFFVARIVHTHSIDSSKVVVTDPDGATKVAEYYPLGMHATAAIAASLGHPKVGRLLLDFTVIFAAVVFPLGMFVLARFLVPERGLVAGLTAFLTPILTLFTYPAMQLGILAMLVCMAMVPVSIVIVTRSFRVDIAPTVSAWLRALMPTALVVAAVMTVHPSEIVILMLMVALLLVGYLRSGRRALINVVGRILALMLILLVMLSPIISGLASGASERSSYDPFATSKPLSVGEAIMHTVGLNNASVTAADLTRVGHKLSPVQHRQVLYGILAVVGAAICLWRRRPAFVVGWAIVIALTVIAYTSNGALSRALTSAWYRQGYRVTMNQAFFVPFFAAVFLEAALAGLGRRLPTRHGLVGPTATITAFAVVALGIQGYRGATATVQQSFGTSEMKMMPAAERAFAWLRRHARANDTVINEKNVVDGSSWMYAEADVRPLFAARPGDGNIGLALTLTTPDLRARQYLSEHVNQLGNSAAVDALARGYHARWVYYGESAIFPFVHELRLSALRRNPHLHEVFKRGGVHVFEVDIPMPST